MLLNFFSTMTESDFANAPLFVSDSKIKYFLSIPENESGLLHFGQ
jgi:hypothetical protein